MNLLKKIKRQVKKNPANEEFVDDPINDIGEETLTQIYESIEKINKKYKKPSGFISRTFSTISGNIILIGVLGGTGYYLYNLQKKIKNLS